MAGQPAHSDRVGVVVIHGVGETDPGWINRYFIPRLQAHDPTLQFMDHSEVHELPRGGEPGRPEQFLSFLRRTERSGRQVAVMELFWADISRFGRGRALGDLVVFLQLFYEAPLVLGSAFLRRPQGGLRKLLAKLVLIANWLLRWPITGLNSAVFTAAVAMLLLAKAREVGPLAPYLDFPDMHAAAAALAMLVGGAIWLARKSRGESILLTELAVSGGIFGGLMLALILGAIVLGLPHADGPAPFLHLASIPILALFWLWSHIVVAAILVLIAATLWGVARGRRGKSGTLMRSAAALGLTTIQGMIFKVVIASTWFLLIGALEPGSVSSGQCLTQSASDCRYLNLLSSDLVTIVIINLTMMAILGLGVIVLDFYRNLVVKLQISGAFAGRPRVRSLLDSMKQPRLIISPVLMAVMFTLTLANFAAYYGPRYAERLAGVGWQGLSAPFDIVLFVRQVLYDSGLIAPFAGMSLMLLYIIGFRAAQKELRGVVHIVRDLVDHQYTPEFRYTKFMLAEDRHERGSYPRRQRIQDRLDSLMQTIVYEEHCQHLILVGHSQGSVILYDYLRSPRDDKTLARASRIDVITLGSPIGHIYQHYFPYYEHGAMATGDLNSKLTSWTNMWRVDDPIGNRIDVLADEFIRNEELPLGGHVDYWKEPRVCELIVELIEEGAMTRATPPPIPPMHRPVARLESPLLGALT